MSNLSDFLTEHGDPSGIRPKETQREFQDGAFAGTGDAEDGLGLATRQAE